MNRSACTSIRIILFDLSGFGWWPFYFAMRLGVTPTIILYFSPFCAMG